ncbi:unnamed protein product [Notodromas monacha]|uniref:Receptor protein-tyrosine kinase n=1 Tax=Notodromas monacha TaxID=399045 RepID=A0A7R9GBS1_9CRUS|nr:unnamed protein product [Notodromas monacha]CAG0915353.1 unnamed protein product [Notodromas monacha]
MIWKRIANPANVLMAAWQKGWVRLSWQLALLFSGHNSVMEDDECVPCDGVCPRQCKADDEVIHSGNVGAFEGCEMIEGSIKIMDHSFTGFRPLGKEGSTFLGEPHPPMHPDRLEVFSSLRRVTGFISIQANHPAFKNLSYFRNLEEIKGVDMTEFSSALYIIKTSLEFLGLRSLKTIMEGAVSILENDKLCLVDSVDWSLIKRSSYMPLLMNNSSPEKCRRAGLVCHKQCSDEGCWGPGPDQCVSCRNFKFEQSCVDACNPRDGLYEADGKVCARCHSECKQMCRGPGAGNCTDCLHVKDGPFCVAQCPGTKYQQGGVCKDCHANCDDGCDGPGAFIGPRGCHSCKRGIADFYNNVTVVNCLPEEAPCPAGYFSEYVGEKEENKALKPMSGKYVCRKCHERCKQCTGYGFHVSVCSECTYVRKGEQCEVECPLDFFEDKPRKECVPCHSECRMCHGPLASDCSSCLHYRLYQDPDSFDSAKNTTMPYNCTATCPEDFPHKVFPKDSSDAYCARDMSLLGCVSGFEVLIFIECH